MKSESDIVNSLKVATSSFINRSAVNKLKSSVFFIKVWMLTRYLAHNARLWGGLVAAQRRKGRPSPEGATTAVC